MRRRRTLVACKKKAQKGLAQSGDEAEATEDEDEVQGGMVDKLKNKKNILRN